MMARQILLNGVPFVEILYQLHTGVVEVCALRSTAGELLMLSAVCRGCGCVEWAPCAGGCSWAAPFLCSACVESTQLIATP